jgi:hypothetical protein
VSEQDTIAGPQQRMLLSRCCPGQSWPANWPSLLAELQRPVAKLLSPDLPVPGVLAGLPGLVFNFNLKFTVESSLFNLLPTERHIHSVFFFSHAQNLTRIAIMMNSESKPLSPRSNFKTSLKGWFPSNIWSATFPQQS